MPDTKSSINLTWSLVGEPLFCQNFEKCTLVAGHFILNQIFKNVDLGQRGDTPGDTLTPSQSQPRGWPRVARCHSF